MTLIALAVHLGDDGKTFFARAAGFYLRHREEEALQKSTPSDSTVRTSSAVSRPSATTLHWPAAGRA